MRLLFALFSIMSLAGQVLSQESVATPAGETALQVVHHALLVELDPEARSLTVTDRVTLPAELQDSGLKFHLSDALEIHSSSMALVRAVDDDSEAHTASYELSQSSPELLLNYGGVFDFGLSDKKEEYTRGFRESRGVVSSEGVYLHGGSAWIPRFGDEMVTFSVEVAAPDNWHVISQGSGNSQVVAGTARWESTDLLEQVYLVGGPLTRFRDAAGDVQALVYLHEADEALANKYLEATAQYIEMYRGLIGPYPYSKFALVENFWETGYGMPSFTLLGPQIVRFPFILHSSYPHEILHNWWGNSVFVDYESGNWCEGLTAYMADHLIQEQRGKGAEYRRSSLQKYRDYVKEGRDLALKDFHSRHNAATEAVGYGKASLSFHMLRRSLGDEDFIAGLQKFFRDNQGRRASFDDLRLAMEAVSERDLASFFDLWIGGVGAPQLVLSDVVLEQNEDVYVLSGRLQQVQAAEPFALSVPVVVSTESGLEEHTLDADQRETEFRIECAARPTGVQVDPLFDLFRLLDPRETPPSIGQIFGEPAVLAVLPSESSGEQTYRELLDNWQSDEHSIEFVLDRDLEELPSDRAVWILGLENRFAPALCASLPMVSREAQGLSLAGEEITFENHAFVVVARHPQNLERALGWIVLDPREALAGLARKLPHYGKYSYLAFEGAEPTNVAKGQWDTAQSPLTVKLGAEPLVAIKDERRALAELPPVFSAGRLKDHVDWLAAPERAGRGLGSPELDAAADYIAAAFADCGLEPGGTNHSWFQEFTVPEGPTGEPTQAKNVIGILRGTRADWSDQSIVFGAHFDHLGLGWPDVHAGEEGSIHPGADDNASGVAVLIELARQIASAGGASRNLVVVAFSAEECGRLGSEAYVSSPRFPVSGMRGMINLDTVGSLADGAISIHGTSSADEWQHIFRGAGFVTGIPNKIVPNMAEGSDQWSFIQAGVPAVQIFTRATADYHRASDTPDKIDPEDLIKVASFVREGVVYMLEREEPLTTQFNAGSAGATDASAGTAQGGRKVSFGSVPDFAFEGVGMRLEGLTPNSPAEKAGLLPGDVLIRVDADEITDLRSFSQCLKGLSAGQTVRVVVLRAGQELEAQVTLAAR